MTREIIEAVHVIEKEKGIDGATLIAALEDALLAAYKKTPGASRHATVELDDEGDFRVYSIELPSDIEERLIEEARERTITELEALEAENGEHSHTLVNDEDLDIDWSEVPPEQVKRADVTPHDFGRIAAQTAKQVILQRIREAEREMMYEEYVDRVTEVVTGIVQQAGDRNNVLVDLGKVEALLPRSEQVDGERYEQGSRIKAVITEVRSGTKGPQVILSRRDPELIGRSSSSRFPRSRTASSRSAASPASRATARRSPSSRTPRASTRSAPASAQGGRACAWSSPSCAARRSTSSRGTPSLPASSRRLSRPARVREVLVDDETKEATVIVPEDQLALAIGKEGLNARLAARLTGWKVDIQSDAEFAQAEAEAAFAGGAGRRGVLRPLLGDSRQRQALPERRRPRLALLRDSRAPRARRARGAGRDARGLAGRRRDERRRARGRSSPRRRKTAEPVAEEPPVEEATEEAPVAEEPAEPVEEVLAAGTPPRSRSSLRKRRSSPRSRSPSSTLLPRRKTSQQRRELKPGKDVRRLWPEGAEGRAHAVRSAARER